MDSAASGSVRYLRAAGCPPSILVTVAIRLAALAPAGAAGFGADAGGIVRPFGIGLRAGGFFGRLPPALAEEEFCFGHAIPFVRHLLHAFRVLPGKVVQFRAVFREVVKFPGLTAKADNFPTIG